MSTESPLRNEKWFTNEFLEQILRQVENDVTISVIGSDIEDVGEKGDHYGSTMYRITVKVKNHSKESDCKSLIIKLNPDTKLGNAMSRGFPREINMFSNILPKMRTLLENAMPKQQHEFGAKHYYSENEVPYVLMLEDLSVGGFKLADRSVGFDFPHCELVLKTLARFHASSVALYEKNPELFRIHKVPFFFETQKMEEFFTSMSNNQFKTVSNVVEKWPNGGHLAKKLRKRTKTIFKDIKNIYESQSNFNVLAHGDMWINNMMFRYDDVTGDLQDIKLVDYQLCTVASPMIDLHYFFHTSIRDDIREHRIKDLLEIYHTELVNTLLLLGYGHKAVTFEELLQEYNDKVLLGLFWSVVCLPLMMTQRGVEHDIDELSRDDDDDSKNRSISKESETVLKRLLPYFEKMGLF